MPSAAEFAVAQRRAGTPRHIIRKVLQQAGVVDEAGEVIPGMGARDIDQLLVAKDKAKQAATRAPRQPVPAAVGIMQEQRDSLRATAEGQAEKALYAPTAQGAGPPIASIDWDVRGAIDDANKRGLLSPNLSRRAAAEAGANRLYGTQGPVAAPVRGPGPWADRYVMPPKGVTPESIEDLTTPSFGEKVKSILGSVPDTAMLLGAAPAILGGVEPPGQAAAEFEKLPRKVMGEGRAVPPGGRSVHSPTVVSTAFDALSTAQRALVGVAEVVRRDRPGESLYQTLGSPLKFPSWSEGEPRDATMLGRRIVAEHGINPDSATGVAIVAVGTALADPMWVSGGARLAKVLVAEQQVADIARAGLRAAGLRGANLDAQAAAFARTSSQMIRAAGDIGAAREALRAKFADEIGVPAIKAFDNLGISWGEQGIMAHVPIVGGRGRLQVELVGAQTVRKTLGAAGRAAKVLPGGQAVADRLAAVRRVFDPSAPPKGVAADETWWHDYYRQKQSTAHVAEHIERAEVGKIAAVSPHLSRLGKGAKPADDPALMNSDAILDFLASPARVAKAEQETGTAVLNYPAQLSTERWAHSQYAEITGAVGDGTLLPHRDLTGGTDLAYQSTESHIIREGYRQAVIAGQKEGLDGAGAAERLHAYVTAGLKHEGWADDAAEAIAMDIYPRAEVALNTDIPKNERAWRSLDSRLKAMVGFHESTEKGLHAARAARVAPAAKSMAKRAAAQARTAALAEGKGAKEARAAAGIAYNKAHDEVMAKVGAEIDNHFTHIIRNREAVRRPASGQPVTGANPAKHRKFVNVVENYEHGQNPVTDLMMATTATAQSHARFMGKMEAIDLLTRDSRWAVKGENVAGLRAKDGWQPWTHPITGEKFTMRAAVIKDFERAIAGYDPKGVEWIMRGVESIAPWLGRPLAGWKSRATHGRPLFYNLRNMVGDGFRMHLGGYDGNPFTAKEAMQVALMGHLEKEEATRAVIKAVRRGGPSFADRLHDGFNNKLRELAQREIVQKATGTKATFQQAYQQAARLGVVDKGFTGHELGNPMDMTRPAKRFSPLDLWFKDFNPLHKDHVLFGEGGFYLKTTGNLARAAENQRRMTAFLSSWKQGNTWEEAAATVRRWLFDYDELTDAERSVIRPLAAFYTFNKKALAAHWLGVRQNPGRYLAIGHAKRAIEESAESKHGPIAVTPAWLEDTEAIRIPMQTAQGSDYFLSLGLDYTVGNLLNPGLPGLDTEGRAGLYDEITPIYDWAQLMLSGRDPRSGRDLSQEWSEPDATLMAAVRAWNKTVGLTDAFKVAVKPMVGKDGRAYDTLPARMVWTYNKMLPNVIMLGRVVGEGKADPFEQEQEYARLFRELTGIGLYVNNPLKAATQHLRALTETLGPAVRGVE